MCPLGMLRREGHDVHPLRSLHRIMLEKYETKIWGTWESNPGPNGSWTDHQPLGHLNAFVNKISNENNIWKINDMLENQQNARYV